MIEFLEAPVPLLVGISDEYLCRTLPKDWPRSVVFVHLDENKVFFENSDDALLDKSPSIRCRYEYSFTSVCYVYRGSLYQRCI